MALAQTTIAVRFTPRARRDAVGGWESDVRHVRVNAPPLDGRANRSLLALLSRALGVPSGDLRLIRGEKSRDKVVAVAGLDRGEVRRRIDGAASGR